MDLHLTGKVILVTGGASGIGAAVVAALRGEGAVAVVLDRTAGEGPDWHTLDLRDDAACGAAVASVLASHGRIDGVVNNAGVNDGVGLGAGPAAFRASLDLNLVPAYTMVHLCAEALKASRGAVVNVASKVGLTGQGGTSAYAAAKAGMLGLTREWAVDFAPSGVRVNAVVPAEVMTPMYRRWLDGFDDPEGKAASIFSRIPLGGRATTAEEMADAVVWLLSARSGHTTGQWHFVDGGYVHLDRGVMG
jgi:L-fucose dehydrogenase